MCYNNPESQYKVGVVAIIGPTLTDAGMNVKKVVDKGQTPSFMIVGGVTSDNYIFR